MSKDENTDEVFDVLNGYSSLKHIELDENDNTSALMRNIKLPGFSNKDSSQSSKLDDKVDEKVKYDKYSFMQKETNFKSGSKSWVWLQLFNRNCNNGEKDHIR